MLNPNHVGLSHPFLEQGPGALKIGKIINIFGNWEKIAHLLNEEKK